MLPPLGDRRRNSKEQQVLAEVTNLRTSDKSEEVTERFRRWVEKHWSSLKHIGVGIRLHRASRGHRP